MGVVKFFKTLLLTVALVFLTSVSYALSAMDTNYPSVIQLKQLQMKSGLAKNIEQKPRLLARAHKRHKMRSRA